MPEKSVAETQQEWVDRIIENCDDMAQVIILLRDMAKARSDDAELASLVGQLHEAYCKMADTLSIRILLNGIARKLECAGDTTPK